MVSAPQSPSPLTDARATARATTQTDGDGLWICGALAEHQPLKYHKDHEKDNEHQKRRDNRSDAFQREGYILFAPTRHSFSLSTPEPRTSSRTNSHALRALRRHTR
jgi:hypothetical protein